MQLIMGPESLYCRALTRLFVPFELISSHDCPALGAKAFLPVARLLDIILLRLRNHLLIAKLALLALLMCLQVAGEHQLPTSTTTNLPVGSRPLSRARFGWFPGLLTIFHI